jgi:hypothetical protein
LARRQLPTRRRYPTHRQLQALLKLAMSLLPKRKLRIEKSTASTAITNTAKRHRLAGSRAKMDC